MPVKPGRIGPDKRHPYADSPQFKQANPGPWVRDISVPHEPIGLPDPPTPEEMRDTWIYFIQQGEDGPIKIGRTTGDPAKRLASIQTGNPFPLVVRNVIRADADFERRLHNRFADCRMRGEWFRPTPELVEFAREPDWDNWDPWEGMRHPTWRCQKCERDIGAGGQTKCWNCDPDQWEAAA